MKKALLIIDVQNDFCEGGSLAVPKANSLLNYINEQMNDPGYDEIILSQDFHPAAHKSFASVHKKPVGATILLNDQPQILWPDHCVQGTIGAEFHPDLDLNQITKIIQKGTNPEVDSYSAFYDNDHKSSTGLTAYLKSKYITTIDVAGLALDYCVKYSCLDAAAEGFKTNLLYKGTAAVNLHPDDFKKTIFILLDNGVSIKT